MPGVDTEQAVVDTSYALQHDEGNFLFLNCGKNGEWPCTGFSGRPRRAQVRGHVSQFYPELEPVSRGMYNTRPEPPTKRRLRSSSCTAKSSAPSSPTTSSSSTAKKLVAVREGPGDDDDDDDDGGGQVRAVFTDRTCSAPGAGPSSSGLTATTAPSAGTSSPGPRTTNSRGSCPFTSSACCAT